MPQSGLEEGITVADTGSLDRWVKEVFAKVPGVVEGYVYDQTKLVMRDFFQRTKAWRTVEGPFVIPANDGTYQFNPYDGSANVSKILRVYRNGTDFVPIEITKIQASIEGSSNVPLYYYVEPYDTIVLSPVNNQALTNVYADIALVPSIDCDNRLPSWIEDQFYEAILAGTLHRLYSEPEKVYTNVTSAEYWGKRYRSEMVRARANSNLNYKHGPAPWNFPRHTR